MLRRLKQGSRRAPGLRASALIVAMVLLASASDAQTSDNLLLVVNDKSSLSLRLGEYYARKRSIQSTHVVHLQAATTDAVSRAEFDASIQTPIATQLSRYGLQDKVLYLVLTKGVPLRITGTGGLSGTVASVDSELTLLYRRLLGLQPPVSGRVPNPFFLADTSVVQARPFTRFTSDIYLVTRLDGFTVDDAIALIDRGAAPSRDGRIVLDQKATLIDRGGDDWLQQAADRLRDGNASDRVALESTRAVAAVTGPVLGYYSWGSNDPANQRRRSGLQFSPGAIGGTFVSTDGRTFAEPPTDWAPSNPEGRGPLFGGSFQSLAGDLIRDGITGVSAHVAEPYLDATIRPQILFPAYLAGFNLAESFYLAMPFLSWQTVIVGDPLCAPFPRKTLAPEDIASDTDPETELPGLFAARRLAMLSRTGLNLDALRLTLKAEAEVAHGNSNNLEPLLVRATDLEPRLTAAQLLLAQTYEARNDTAKASDRYRRVLAVEPRNVQALNNLAYAIATTGNMPKDALPLAERAFRLSKAPFVLDTLGWIHHLLGDDRMAAPLIERAAAASPASAPLLLHAAVVHAALKDASKARQELAAALKLDPRLAESAEVKALRSRLAI